MTYVELHCHSAYSFLDGASQPEELAARAAELGLRGARAHRPRRRLRLARVRARGEGVRRAPDHRRGGHARRRRARHAARRVAARLREPLPPAHRRARGNAPRWSRGSGAAAASVSLQARRRAARRGSSASPAARATASGSSTRTRPRRLAGAFGRERFYVELQRPFERGDTRRLGAPARPRGAPRRRDGRDRRRPRAPSAPHAAPGRARRDPLPHVARGLRARAARQPRELPPLARGDARALLRSTAPPRSGARRSPSGSSSTSPRSSATATRTSRTARSRRSASSPRSASARSTSGIASGDALQRQGARAPRATSSR